MRNFKDESFIGQYLSPKVMRDMRLFAILDDEHRSTCASRRSTTRGLPRGARGAVEAVRPGVARAQHPGLERQPARRPRAHLAPHAAQQPPAARKRAGGAQARRAAVGVRRATWRAWSSGATSAPTGRSHRPRRRLFETTLRRSEQGRSLPCSAREPPGLLPPRFAPLPPRGRGRPRWGRFLESEDLAWVEDVLRIEGALERAHHGDRVRRRLPRRESPSCAGRRRARRCRCPRTRVRV